MTIFCLAPQLIEAVKKRAMYNVSDPYVADSVDVRFFGLLTDQLYVMHLSILCPTTSHLGRWQELYGALTEEEPENEVCEEEDVVY